MSIERAKHKPWRHSNMVPTAARLAARVQKVSRFFSTQASACLQIKVCNLEISINWNEGVDINLKVAERDWTCKNIARTRTVSARFTHQELRGIWFLLYCLFSQDWIWPNLVSISIIICNGRPLLWWTSYLNFRFKGPLQRRKLYCKPFATSHTTIVKTSIINEHNLWKHHMYSILLYILVPPDFRMICQI